eukprot:gene14379-biopygen6575
MERMCAVCAARIPRSKGRRGGGMLRNAVHRRSSALLPFCCLQPFYPARRAAAALQLADGAEEGGGHRAARCL